MTGGGRLLPKNSRVLWLSQIFLPRTTGTKNLLPRHFSLLDAGRGNPQLWYWALIETEKQSFLGISGEFTVAYAAWTRTIGAGKRLCMPCQEHYMFRER
jgi:hypothetical protein